jgi:hypothetical protein
MRKKDLEGAADQFRKYLQYSPGTADTSRARKELAEIEKALRPEAKK